MAISNDEKQELLNELLNSIKAESQSIDELRNVESLDGVSSLPAKVGEELVTVPISLLGKPAEDAAKNANSMAQNAQAAAANANAQAESARQQAADAKAAATEAKEAATLVEEAMTTLSDITGRSIQGQTARFDGIINTATINSSLTTTPGGVIIYVIAAQRFAYLVDSAYYADWSVDDVTAVEMFIGSDGTILKNKTYLLGEVLYVWSDNDNNLVEISGNGGGNTINVTELYPLTNGYYTLANAIVVVEDKQRVKGTCLTYEVAQGKWETKQFVGTSLESWEIAASWEDFGGAGTVKSLTINGTTIAPDETGNVSLNFDETETDESLDINSTNPVQNSAVTAKINEIDANTVFGASAELSDDESTVRLALTNKSGAEIIAVDLPAGSGGTGGDTQTTKIVLNASVDNTTIKEGGNAMLTYTYDHQNVGGDEAGSSTGQKATVLITLKRGSTTIYTSTLSDVSKGNYQLDISKYLFVGTTDIYVKATVTDPATGKEQTKQSYVSVKVVTLSLSSSYNLASNITSGGYANSDTVSVPFSVSGSGTKIVTLYVDGVQTDSRTVTKSGTSNGSFSIPMVGKSVGRHNIQIVAEMEASSDLTLRSESVYIDVLKKGSSLPYIGMMFTSPLGTIFEGHNYLNPHVSVGQYEQLSLSYIVYDASVTPAQMKVHRDGVTIQTVSVPRAIQSYSNRFTEKSAIEMKFICGATDYPFVIDVTDSGIEISETTYGLMMKLSATGRSNEEANPAVWENGGYTTTFEDVDFKTSGWTGSSLKLMNGAKAYINCMPFKTDAATNGCTVELEYKVSNVLDAEQNVISCLSANKGFQITGEKVSMYTGSTKQVTDEDGNTTIQPVGVGRQYGKDIWVKIAFTIGKRTDGRLMELYVDGTRSAADIYSEGDNFMQEMPAGITIESDGADVEVRIIRYYSRAISDDEEVDNCIVDTQTVEAMINLFEENDVLSDDGESIDFEKLRQKGKAIMLVVRSGGLDPVNAENNKKTDFLSDVYLWLPDGRYVYLHNINIRIQGTSSTKYARKNYRIYCAKGDTPELYIDGVKQEDLKLALRFGQTAVKVLCAKADFSDSSMVQNTGGAQIYNRMMKSLDFLTPPQRLDESVRVAVDGYPIDVYASETLESTPQYYGQYNLNHDKSDWYDIIGMKGVAGLDAPCPIAFEFLNNTEPIGLFQGAVDLDVQAEISFDNALEFNYPKDVTWADATEAQKTAYKRLWGWIRDCVPAGADVNDLSTFVSEKFRTEVEQYFDKNFLITWYLYTDYDAMVDQRVKNMILATWNGLLWYFIYYDGDTQLGGRNDSFLAYLYDITRDTWDAEKSKYAFEGHDSWLWCLLLANMKDELREMATKMRTILTEEMVNNVFDNEQQGNWSARTYNKSGKFKYIIPQIEGVIVGGENVKYPHIYALQGNKQSFRRWFIKKRYALKDAEYGTGNYLSDNIDMYMSRGASDTVNTIDVTSNELYYFGYGTNNAPHLQESQKADKGEVITLRFTNAFTVNDPLRLYGAGCMAELDMRGAANNITGDINLNKCGVLRKLDISTTGPGSNGWCMVLDQCKHLTEININGQTNARTGTLSSTELNFTNQTKLERLDAGGVYVDGVVFAQGAPITYVRLPNNIKTLRLEYLPLLTNNGLVVANYTNVETFRFSSCPNLDCWTILSRCTNVKRMRITDVDLEGDGTLLNKYMTTGGVDLEGNATDTCALVGTYQLTTYVTDEDYNSYATHYPELNIKQPQYTMIEFDDTVSADDNVSNLDNKTGYKYANSYVMSGHLSKIFSRRFRCLAKQAVKGTMTIYPLHNENSNYYADAEVVTAATLAKLDGTEGDVMMYEPHYWFKGINDYLNNKKYSCYSSNAAMPDIPDATVICYEDILSAGNVKASYKLLSGKADLQTSYTADSGYSVCRVNVSGYKKVRFPTVPGTGLMCSIFSDDNGTIIDTKLVNTLVGKFEPGMYLIANIPEGAEWINFTIQKTAEFDKVVLSNSNNIEDMEPDWVEHEACLVGVFETTIVNTKFRSCVSGGASSGSMTWTDFNYYSAARNMQQIDYEMHRDIANLFFAKYGRRDSQSQCGAGQHSNGRTTGGSASRGMQDTIGYDEAYTINPNITNSLVDNINPQYAWYKEIDEYGGTTVKQVNNTCCIGYEDVFGDKYEMMDNVMVNKDTVDYKWTITMPDGSIRKVKGSPTSGMWITGVVHGKFMDIIPAGSISGSNSSHYGDIFYISGSTSRVVYRGYNNAYSNGGVSNANANSDSSNSYSNVGSRLAFRGRIVIASSVSEFKALIEIA